AVQQPHLCVGRRLHIPLTHSQIVRSKEFCRGLRLFVIKDLQLSCPFRLRAELSLQIQEPLFDFSLSVWLAQRLPRRRPEGQFDVEPMGSAGLLAKTKWKWK
ncbi:MAG: hypothetical protein WBW41_14930, partial [Verrucomicrobiia bacterium]